MGHRGQQTAAHWPSFLDVPEFANMRKRLSVWVIAGGLSPALGCYDYCGEQKTISCTNQGSVMLNGAPEGDLMGLQAADISFGSLPTSASAFTLSTRAVQTSPLVDLTVLVDQNGAVPEVISLPSPIVKLAGSLGSLTSGVLSTSGTMHISRITPLAFEATFDLLLTDDAGHRLALSGNVSHADCREETHCSRKD
jgi:hypothetical protein